MVPYILDVAGKRFITLASSAGGTSKLVVWRGGRSWNEYVRIHYWGTHVEEP